VSTFLVPFPARIEPEALGPRALAVAEAKGWATWSLRDVARDLGVTPNALYRHVGDRAGLVVLMGEAAIRELQAALRLDHRQSNRSPDTDVLDMCRRFVRFAMERPHAFDALNQAKPAIEHPSHDAWVELWVDMRDIVKAQTPNAADAASFALWAFLLGRVELARGVASRASVEAGLEHAVTALLAGFRAISPVPSPLPPHVRRDD